MNPQELRICNWVYAYPKNVETSGQYRQILAQDIAYMAAGRMDEKSIAVEPIPLSADLFERCGFVAEDFGGVKLSEYRKNNIVFAYVPGGREIYQLVYGRHCFQTYIKYVHELQNLYFALKREELTVNL